MMSLGNKHFNSDKKLTLKNLIHEFRDIFLVKPEDDPPVDVEPMYIEFEGTTRPIKVRQRTYSLDQLLFLKKKIEEPIDAGYITSNSASK